MKVIELVQAAKASNKEAFGNVAEVVAARAAAKTAQSAKVAGNRAAGEGDAVAARKAVRAQARGIAAKSRPARKAT